MNVSLYFQHRPIPIFILIYVDNILLLSPNASAISHLISLLQHPFAIYDLGPVHYFFGIEFTPHANEYLLSQTQYLSNLLSHTGMVSYKPLATTCSTSSSVTKALTPIDPTHYHNIIGSL